MMKRTFGNLPDGTPASLYTFGAGRVQAAVTDLGATLVSVWVDGVDVVLGYDDAAGYVNNDGFLGAVVGRNANRIQGSAFPLNGETVRLTPNEGANNLHSGPDCWNTRLWKVESVTDCSIRLSLHSPHGDQGFPGNADIVVTYTIENDALTVAYDAVSDQDTVFNLTNHAYFNLAGENHPELAMDQTLMVNANAFNPDDAQNIPTGECRSVAGNPFDFRAPKALGLEIGADYEPLHLQAGYDHNFILAGTPCAVLQDPGSGRTMTVTTDCPGVQVYTANFLEVVGKNGLPYPKRSGVCLETQYAPNSVNHPEWPQPFVKAGVPYHSETKFQF